MGRVLTLLNVGYYIPDILLSISPCGTNLHTILTFQATWREEERRIVRLIERWALIT